MGINPVGQANVAPQQSTTSAKGSNMAQAAQTTSAPKQDTFVVSQKAKDLAAAKAGKAMQEEANESMSAKLQEAQGS